MLEGEVTEADDEQVFADAQEPVRERLGAGVGGGAGARLRQVASRGHGATQQRDEPLHRRRGVAEGGDGDQRASDGADSGVDDIPDGVDIRNLVGKELDQVHRDRGGDDDIAVEGLELRRQADPAVARGQTQNGNRRVEIDSGGKRKPECPAQRGHQVHTGPSCNNFCTSARARAISSSRSSRRRPIVGIGFPMRTLTWTGRTIGLPLRIAALAPLMATGTTGTCASIAITNPPFLNGSRSPVRLRVPSGKMRNELPARSDSAPREIEASAFSRSARSTATKPPTSNTFPMIGNFRSSAL